MRHRGCGRGMLLVLLPLCGACAADAEPRAAVEGCPVTQPSTPLPGELDETSGVAASRAHPGILWTHNDSGGDPVVYAVGYDGTLVGAVPVAEARNRDWEDIALGPCPTGECLYIADIGDNSARRDEVTVYRIPEPDPRSGDPVLAERLRFRYPGGARDAEAIFVLPTGELYVIAKGRREPQTLFRYPAPLRPGETVELEPVAELGPEPDDQSRLISAAGAAPNGEWVAVRNYVAMAIYRTSELLAGRTEPALVVDLTPLGLPQGEALDLLDDGRVVLTSEAGFEEGNATLAILACTLPQQKQPGG
jgi:hypothetical protein